MAFSNRQAPNDTAINPEKMDQNIDAKGIGRYYPEEYSGPIQAINNRNQLIADVPKTLAGIVLNYDEHALSTWRAKQEVNLQDKATVNDLLIKNRKEQMELSTDLELYDAQKELESKIFEARKRIISLGGTLGGASEEQAVNEILEDFKDRFQGRIRPDQKWQGILQEYGRRSLVEARLSDWKTDKTFATYAMQNEFNKIHDAVIGLEQNPDGTFKPMMSIKDGMDTFVRNIAPLINLIDAADRPNFMQNALNTFVMDQAKAYIELFQGGQINAETTMNALSELRNTFGGKAHTWTFMKDNDALKDADGNNIKVDLTLDANTDLFLLNAFKDTKNGIGNGGEHIANNVLKDFEERIGWNDIQNQGWSKEILAMTPEDLKYVFLAQANNIIKSTASDSTKIKNVDDLFQKYNTCYMLTGTQKLIRDFGPDALNGIRKTIRDINTLLNTQRENISWQSFDGPVTINSKTYRLGLSPMGPDLKAQFAELGVDISSLSPKLGDTSEEASMYWQNTVTLLEKYANYLEQNNAGEVLNIVNKDVRNAYENAASYLTPSQMFTYEDDHKTIKGFNTENQKNFQKEINKAIDISLKQNSRKHIPISEFDKMLSNINNIPNAAANIQAKRFLVESIEGTSAASDMYVYAHDRLQNQKDDNGLISLSALLNNKDVYNKYINMANQGNANIKIDKDYKERLQENALKIMQDLRVPIEDYNLYNQLQDFCMVAAYNPVLQDVDSVMFSKYFKESLEGQYVDLNNTFFKNLKGTAFSNTKIYRNHPALAPYSKNLDRLKDIGTSVKTQLNNADIPAYLKPQMQNITLVPDMETGMWCLTNNGTPYYALGKKIGIVVDNVNGFKNTKPQDVAALAIINLKSALSIGHYDDYKKEKMKQIERYNRDVVPHLSVTGTKAANTLRPSIETEEEFNRRHAARINILEDNQKIQKILTKYNSMYDLDGGTYSVLYGEERN